MSESRSLRAILWTILGVGLVVAIRFPEVFPRQEYQSIPLIANRTIEGLVDGALIFAPFGVALGLSAGRHTRRREAVAWGLAFTAAGLVVVAAGLTIALNVIGLAFTMSPTAASLAKLRIVVCLGLGGLAAGLLWLGRRPLDGASLRDFGTGVASAIVWAVVAQWCIRGLDSVATGRGRNYYNDFMSNGHAASTAVDEITFCAVGYKQSHRGGVPADLSSLIRAAGCGTRYADSLATPDYHLRFNDDTTDSTLSGSPMGCRITATYIGIGAPPNKREGLLPGYEIVGTCAGVITSRELDDPSLRVRAPLPRLGSLLEALVLDLGQFASQDERRAYPTTLAALKDRHPAMYAAGEYKPTMLDSQATADLEGNSIRVPPYTIRYLPAAAQADGASDFRIEARCDTYGPKCMRSYLVDEMGVVHGAGYDRAATDADPPIAGCELFEGIPCTLTAGRPFERVRHR